MRTVRPAGEPYEVSQLLGSPEFMAGACRRGEKLGMSPTAVRTEVATYLREMAATHDPRVSEVWQRFGRWMIRGYDVLVDDDRLSELRRLDRSRPLVFLISHRSYLDQFVLLPALARGGLSPVFGLAGGNLSFFPLGTLARRNGFMHVRRSTTDLPLYRFALREFIGRLLRNNSNLCWSIEGGRTRTGKLRPPRYGLLRYVAEASDADPMLVPVSLMYDQIPVHEVTRMASEARGQAKEAENIRWLLNYAAGLRERRGRIYLDFGTPLNLRERLAELQAESVTENQVERIALDVCHRLNEATPITPTAAVCVALLAEDRALTLDEVLATVRPFADYVHARGRPVAGPADLTDRSTLRWALTELVRSGVLTVYRGGNEPVYSIGSEQHLIAAFYRNSVIHMLIVRAIAEMSLRAVAQGVIGGPDAVLEQALRTRELLKFDFFFAGRDAFAADLCAEISLMAQTTLDTTAGITAEQAEIWLAKTDLMIAPLVLRPFLDAYRVVADQLVELGEEVVDDEEDVVHRSLRVGHQLALQRNLASAESVSGEMFRTALKLAAHRHLLEGETDMAGSRRAFADEVAALARSISGVAGAA